MLAVSLQPTPLRWILNAVSTGPRETSSGSAVGAIQKVPALRVVAASAHSPWDPPRSSGALKWNSTLPAASAVASATTRERSSQPPVEAERSPLPESMRDATELTAPLPLMRLPVTVVQLSATDLPGVKPAPLTVTGWPTPENSGVATSSPCGGSRRTCAWACCGGGAGSTAGPLEMLKPTLNCGRSGAGDCCMLRYGKVKSECTTSMTGRPAAGTVKRAVPPVVTVEIQPLKRLS